MWPFDEEQEIWVAMVKWTPDTGFELYGVWESKLDADAWIDGLVDGAEGVAVTLQEAA